MKYVASPALPIKGRHIVVGQRYKEALHDGLCSLGLYPLYLPDNPDIDPRLAGHADLSLFHLGGDALLLAPYLKDNSFAAELKELGFHIEFADIHQSAVYPYDTALNACAAGNAVFYSPGVTARQLEEIPGRVMIPVRQGYCGCSICVVDEESIITSDRGIADAALAHGYDVLLISPGYISLHGFNYGFIGGAAFKISDDCMAFTGDISAHPDASKMLSFLRERGIYAKIITDLPVFDVGNCIILTEKY